MTPVELILSKLKGVKKNGKGWTARCPGHEDHQNSLSIGEGTDQRALVKCFAGCSTEIVLKALGLEMADLYPHNQDKKTSIYPTEITATAQSPGCTLEQYAQFKALSVDFLTNLGLVTGKYKAKSRLEIPYLDQGGEVVATRYRWTAGGSGPRFTWKAGSKTLPYGLWKLKEFENQKYLVLVEGESDCHTLWYYGEPALGIPGVATWQGEWETYLELFETIYVVIEPDKGGETTLNWISRSKLKRKIHLLRLAPHKDPSAVHLAEKENFLGFWKEALKIAEPFEEWEAKRKQEKVLEALGACKDLVTSSNILDLFAKDLEKAGVVGVEREAKLIFLAVTSRILERPISLAIKGVSSSGKSYLVQKVLDFFPSEAYFDMTTGSPKALIYNEESFVHKMLLVYEYAGMDNETANYLIRSLLSEGRIKYPTVDKTSEGLKGRTIEKEGPTGLIVTTTKIHLHPENETRLFSITISDTPEQTRRIVLSMAEPRPPIDFNPWQSLQTWLAGQDNRVNIPYKKRLAEMFSSMAVRLRRDFHQVLILIEVHALLCQASRQKNEEGEVVAEMGDYEAVYRLMADLIQQGIGAGISPAIRETVEAVQEILNGKEPGAFVKQAELIGILKLDKATISRRVRAALDPGYLQNLEDHKGRPYKLTLGEPMPDEVEILPSPEKLFGCAVAVKTEG